MDKEIVIALAGNPNSGKTTTFNNLTGARQRVGNYPGVTVERKEGVCAFGGYRIRVIDLPGTYSLTPYSAEEIVTRNFLLFEKPDVVVDVTDSSNLERQLYLAAQLLEFNVPLVITLNMMDVARSRGIKIDIEQLSRLLGVPLIPTVAHSREGIEELLQTVVSIKEGALAPAPARINYGREVEEELEKVEALLGAGGRNLLEDYPRRWLALKLLESDSQVCKAVFKKENVQGLMSAIDGSRRHLEAIFGDDAASVITDRRYGFVEGAYHESTRVTPSERVYTSDIIDTFLTHRVLSLPIFFALMWLVYQLTFIVSEAPTGWIEEGMSFLSGLLTKQLPEGLFSSMVVEGIIGGVGNVLALLPAIMILFLAIAILEDTGYMARVAFIMDRIMHKMGLHGKSVIPMIMGFGCGVPAIMATRTLSSRKDRLITMLIIPLMSCSARLPVYTLMIEAFFKGRNAGNILFSIYILGMVMAVLLARLFRETLFKGPSEPFVMELPPYRLPTFKGLAIHMWERSRLYIKKAGTLILAASVVVWFLGRFPRDGGLAGRYEALREKVTAEYNQKAREAGDKAALNRVLQEKVLVLEKLSARERLEENRYSFAGRIGGAVEPFLRPLGLGDWKVGMALFSGFVAKELVVSTFGTLYQIGEAGEDNLPLREAIRRDATFTPLTAYVFMVFILLYIPCISTIAVLRKESGGWPWPLFAVVYTTLLAWSVSFLVYRLGLLMGFA